MDSHPNKHLPGIAFILGMGRSGTTLLTNMLNSHPQLISAPENEFVVFGHASFQNKDFSDKKEMDAFLNIFTYDFNTEPSIWVPDKKLREEIKNIKEKNYAALCKLAYLNYPLAGTKEDVHMVIDKNPVYSLHIDILNRVYPDAKYIVLVRNYKDNALSRKKYAYKPTSVFELGVSWDFYYRKIADDIARYKLNVHYLRYEDLVSRPEETLKKLCLYLGVAYKTEMLHFEEKAREMKTHLQKQPSDEKSEKVMAMHGNLEREVNTSRVDVHEKELSTEENLQLDFLCGKTGEKFNYNSQNASVPVSWEIKRWFYRLKMQVYLLIKEFYYAMPVGARLAFLKRK